MSTPAAAAPQKKRFVMRTSSKIAMGFVLVAAAGYWGRNWWAANQVDHLQFPIIAPGVVNLIAVDPGKGYRIIVSNQTAQLVQGTGTDFEAPQDSGTASPDGGVDAAPKRVPIREMLQSLGGNEQALNRFVMTMNDMGESKLPPERIIWTAESIQKALDGDKTLQAKLETDLNTKLDGEPLDHLSKSALLNGIVIDCPVPIQVPTASGMQTLTARVLEPFKTTLMRDVELRIENKFDLTDSMLAGYYREAVRERQTKGSSLENVRESLEDQINPQRLSALAVTPERILRTASVVVSDTMIQGASYERVQAQTGKPHFNLKIRLNDEGRLRLWQYSRRHPGFQLLLVQDGIAIAAPRIHGELSQDEVTITQLPDEGLLQEAVDQMNRAATEETKK